MKNAVIYARYSPGSKQTYQSIEGQLKDGYAFAERSGIKIIGEYIDEKLTATNDKRTEFLRMIEDSKRKQFQYIIVYQLDRFARNRYDSATYKARLKKNGVRVLSARENITEDASGILIEGVLESMAEYYSVELGQKIRRGMDLTASKCKYFGGAVPIGYKIDNEKNFVLDEEKAPIVKKMFEMYISGHNYAQLANWLNEHGILTSRGNKWHYTRLHEIFNNRKYLGNYIYKGNEIPNGIPRIIDDTTFAEAQRILARYAQAPSRGKAKVNYILSEKMICGSCGNNTQGVSATSRNKQIHNYYRCASKGKKTDCGKKPIRKQFLEDEIIKEIIRLLTDDFIDLIAAETYLLIQAEKDDMEIKRLEKIVADNQKSINNLMQALMLGKVTDTILAQIEKLETENKELVDTIAYEKSMQIDYTYNDIRKWLTHFRTLDYSKTKYRRDLIETLVYKIILYDSKVKILFHLKGGQQKGELLLNLIYPDYPNENGGNSDNDDNFDNNHTKKEEIYSIPPPLGCSYMSDMVEVTGFEPAASWSRTMRATKLRYTSILAVSR